MACRIVILSISAITINIILKLIIMQGVGLDNDFQQPRGL